MDYLPTLGEKWPHSEGNVGKYSIHGSYGNMDLLFSRGENPPIFRELQPFNTTSGGSNPRLSGLETITTTIQGDMVLITTEVDLMHGWLVAAQTFFIFTPIWGRLPF